MTRTGTSFCASLIVLGALSEHRAPLRGVAVVLMFTLDPRIETFAG